MIYLYSLTFTDTYGSALKPLTDACFGAWCCVSFDHRKVKGRGLYGCWNLKQLHGATVSSKVTDQPVVSAIGRTGTQFLYLQSFPHLKFHKNNYLLGGLKLMYSAWTSLAFDFAL